MFLIYFNKKSEMLLISLPRAQSNIATYWITLVMTLYIIPAQDITMQKIRTGGKMLRHMDRKDPRAWKSIIQSTPALSRLLIYSHSLRQNKPWTLSIFFTVLHLPVLLLQLFS